MSHIYIYIYIYMIGWTVKPRDILKVKNALLKSTSYRVTERAVGSVVHFLTLRQVTQSCNSFCATHGRCGSPFTSRQHVRWKCTRMSLLLAVSAGATCEWRRCYRQKTNECEPVRSVSEMCSTQLPLYLQEGHKHTSRSHNCQPLTVDMFDNTQIS